MGRRLLTMVVLLLMSEVVLADVPLRAYLGEDVAWRSARDIARGGARGLDPGAAAVFDRPEALGFADRAFAELSYGLGLSSEQRVQAVYDQFETRIGEAAFADNHTSTGLPGPFVGAYPFASGLVVGAGIAPVVDYAYSYERVYRDDYYTEVGRDRITQTGSIHMASLGVGCRPLAWLGFGTGAGYLFGSRALRIGWERDGADSSYEEVGRPAGVRLGGGIVVQPVTAMAVDVGFRSGVSLANWREEGEITDFELPWQADLGVSYRAAGRMPSLVTAEIRYRPEHVVTVVGDSLRAVSMDDVLLVGVGVEHTMLDFMRLRYGFGVEPLGFDRTVQVVQVGAGLGFDAGPVVVDFGGMLVKGALRREHLRRSTGPEDQTVYESTVVLGLTVSRRF